QLALRLAGQIELIALTKGSDIAAFGWCTFDSSTYHMMYAGVDFELNSQCDLYFNLMYAGFDRALRSGRRRINAGQTATVFKARMGCYPEPLYIYARGLGPVLSRIFHYGSGFLVNALPPNPPAHIFKGRVAPDPTAAS